VVMMERAPPLGPHEREGSLIPGYPIGYQHSFVWL
jgi:hypothetical protein